MHALIIHGGAGVVLERIGPRRHREYAASLGRIADAAFDVLAGGGSSLDAVSLAVAELEDDPLFNAGYGAALNRDGIAELDASIMDGRDCSAGAVACVTHIRNPVLLARRVMDSSPHVLLVGQGAEEFALNEGLSFIPNTNLRTIERQEQLESEQRGERGGDVAAAQGTVGAVALDCHGHLAAATSTGGTTNKLPGRVGDTPIIGAGTYAKDNVCAVSATGQGEFFIRAAAAYHITSAVERRGISLEAAARELVHEVLPALGGLGGVIAVGAGGELVMDFNTQGMLRAAISSDGRRIVGIGPEALCG